MRMINKISLKLIHALSVLVQSMCKKCTISETKKKTFLPFNRFPFIWYFRYLLSILFFFGDWITKSVKQYIFNNIVYVLMNWLKANKNRDKNDIVFFFCSSSKYKRIRNEVFCFIWRQRHSKRIYIYIRMNSFWSNKWTHRFNKLFIFSREFPVFCVSMTSIIVHQTKKYSILLVHLNKWPIYFDYWIASRTIVSKKKKKCCVWIVLYWLYNFSDQSNPCIWFTFSLSRSFWLCYNSSPLILLNNQCEFCVCVFFCFFFCTHLIPSQATYIWSVNRAMWVISILCNICYFTNPDNFDNWIVIVPLMVSYVDWIIYLLLHLWYDFSRNYKFCDMRS